MNVPLMCFSFPEKRLGYFLMLNNCVTSFAIRGPYRAYSASTIYVKLEAVHRINYCTSVVEGDMLTLY